jgi:excisionase family DNA binding protein
MCSGISFLVGLVFLIRGNFRISNRNVPAQTGRLVGLILMLPLVVGFLYGVAVVNQIGDFGPDILTDERLLNAACVEMAALLMALVLAGYLIYQLPAEPLPAGGPAWGRGPAAAPIQYARVMTTAEVADYLRIPEFEVIALIDEGKLPAARIGSDYRIARSVVEDFLQEHGGSSTT